MAECGVEVEAAQMKEHVALAKRLNRWADGFGDFRYFTLKILDATGALPPMEALNDPQL